MNIWITHINDNCQIYDKKEFGSIFSLVLYSHLLLRDLVQLPTDSAERVTVCYDVNNMASAAAALSRIHRAHSVHSLKGSLTGQKTSSRTASENTTTTDIYTKTNTTSQLSAHWPHQSEQQIPRKRSITSMKQKLGSNQNTSEKQLWIESNLKERGWRASY